MRAPAELGAGLRDDGRHGLDCRDVTPPRDDAEAKGTLRQLAAVLASNPGRDARRRTPEERDADEAEARAQLAVIIANLYALGHHGIDTTGGPLATLARYRSVPRPMGNDGGPIGPPGWDD